MIITRKHLSRRTFLRGAGAVIGLPFLDAMVPALGRAAGAARTPPTRLCYVYVPNGMVMRDWTPAAAGRDFAFTPILKPLEPFRERTLVLSRLMCHNANALGDGPGDHGRAGAAYLTGVHPKKTFGKDIQAGVSMDQIAARALEGKTRFASLELGCEEGVQGGNCDNGYSCAYSNSISWRTPSSPMPPEIRPRAVFERLFGSADEELLAIGKLHLPGAARL